MCRLKNKNFRHLIIWQLGRAFIDIIEASWHYHEASWKLLKHQGKSLKHHGTMML